MGFRVQGILGWLASASHGSSEGGRRFGCKVLPRRVMASSSAREKI